MQNQTIGFIGAGNMAASLIGGLIEAGFSANNIWASDLDLEKLNILKQRYKINIDQDNQIIAKSVEVLVFAVKPQVMKQTAQDLQKIIQNKKPLIITIAAGIRSDDFQNWLGGNQAIIRCMPNTPALIQCGATALFSNSSVSEQQKHLAESLLRSVGITVWVTEESQLDVVTALSGSGPAYFFLIMDALEQAAIKLGLTAETAHLLTLQTTLGAAKMALESEHSLEQLRNNVTSPGGTTEAALKTLFSANISSILHDAINAAKIRSAELAEQFGK